MENNTTPIPDTMSCAICGYFCNNYHHYNNWFDTAKPVAELPKEAEQVAKELVEKFYEVLLVDGSLNEKRICYGYAKQCAIIYCDGMIDESSDNIVTIGRGGLSNKDYWQQVRTAINQI